MLGTTTAAVAQPRYEGAIAEIERIVADELERGIIKGVSIAIVDDQTVVHARGYGLAHLDPATPATEKSIYRVGSISKVVNALAIAQLVDQGKLDLDVPITQYDPTFHINNPFDNTEAITLRHLLCHRSGLVRESPVGSYFDMSEPSIMESVASLASCALVEPPNTRTRYSNIGPTVAGRVLEQVTGNTYDLHLREHLLEPLGMTSADFSRPESEHVATGYMRIAQPDGSFVYHQPAPVFELATSPAGNLYASAEDLAQLAKMIFAGGKANGKQIISEKMLKEVFTVQLTDADSGFGLGFMISNFAGHRAVSHNGAVYGFSCSFIALPETKVAVIVLTNEDIASGPLARITHHAMHQVLHAKTGQDLPAVAATVELSATDAEAIVGEYESESYWATISTGDDGEVFANISSQEMTLRHVGSLRFEADGRFVHAGGVAFERDGEGSVTGFTALGQRFKRVDPDAVEPLPAAWERLLGVYGDPIIPQIISVRHGHLYAMTENMVDYRMRPLNQAVFHMSPGLYAHEQTVFQFDADGIVHSIIMANVLMPRRDDE